MPLPHCAGRPPRSAGSSSTMRVADGMTVDGLVGRVLRPALIGGLVPGAPNGARRGRGSTLLHALNQLSSSTRDAEGPPPLETRRLALHPELILGGVLSPDSAALPCA